MINEDDKVKIINFFKVLGNISHTPGQIFDLGLVISNLLTAEELAGMRDNFNIFKIQDENNHPDFLLTALKQAFKEKKWLLIDWQAGNVNSGMYQVLRRLSVDNTIQIERQDKSESIKMPAETRVVVLVHPQRLEKFGDYQFIKLFGPVLNL